MTPSLTGLVQPLDAGTLQRDAPDRHLTVVEGGELKARASVWWTTHLRNAGMRVGAIGHYAARDEVTGHEVLSRACDLLQAAGCALAVGPMDGNTWRSYRFVTERGAERPFFLEPDNPAEWPDHFTSAGFAVLATYTSAVVDDLGRRDARLAEAERRLVDAGVTMRSLKCNELEEELHRIHVLSCRAFQRNFLYSPLDEQEFADRYRRLLPFVRAELVLLAEHGDDLVGLLFGVPDHLRGRGGAAILRSAELQLGGTVDTVVIKTVAVAPGRPYAGLGSVLLARAHDRAAQLGYRRAIHALMHEQNGSRNISRRYARTFRRYAVFARPLNVESRVPSPGTRAPNPESRIPSPEPRVPDPEPRVPSPESRVPSQ